MKRKVLIGVIILVLLGTGLTIYFTKGDKGPQFKTVPAVSGPLRATVTATGTMNAVTTVLVGTQVSGTIHKLYVDFNSRVKKGQIIAEIDPSTFQAQVDQAKANVLSANAAVEKAKATARDSRRMRDRYRELFSRNLIARSDADTADATDDANQAQVSATIAQERQAAAALRFAETNLRYTKILSPVEGTVVSRAVDVGQTVAASFQTPTLFTIAQDLTKMQIDTNIDEADIGKIKTGQDVEFSVDAYPDNTFRGIVHQVRIAPITVQNVVTYDVVIKVDNADLRLKPGMTANVSVVVAGKDSVLKVPNAALRFRPGEKDGAQTAPADKGARPVVASVAREMGAAVASGKTPGRAAGPRSYAVWVLENDKPKRLPVTIGISDGTMTEISAGELKAGQEVIIESASKSSKNNAAGQGQQLPRFMR